MPFLLLSAQEAPERNDAPRISLLTCAPGSDIYELEGHTGLRIIHRGADMTANWGVFDFAAPNFVYRFVKGETDYRCAMYDTSLFLDQYLRSGRKVTEQVLNLTPEQALEVVRLVSDNARPQNAVYRYNYVLDNCATRPIAIIERALGDTITLGPTATLPEADMTFRNAMRRYHRHYPWYQFGIDLALGSGIDRPITHRRKGFAPAALREMMEHATIADSSGRQVPLVLTTDTLAPGSDEGIALGPTPWWQTPMAVFMLLLVATIAICLRDLRRRRLSRWFASLFYGLLGLAGCIIAFLVFISVHEATSPNWLMLWINPLCLIAAVAIWLKSCKKAIFWWQIINFATILAFAALWIAGVQSGNPAFIPMMLIDAALSATYIYLTHRHNVTSR